MYHRWYSVPIALVGALGTALTPALASASSQSAQGSVTTRALSSAGYEYSTPAGSSVLHRTSATSPNPGMFVNIAGGLVSTNNVQFDFFIGGLLSGSATVTINWGDKSSITQTVNAPAKPGQIDLDHSHTYSALGIYDIQVQVSDGQGDVATNSIVIETGSDYVPYGPTRILDTRTLGANGAIPSHGTYALKVVGAGAAGTTIPAGVTAVALNVTATDGTGDGFLTVYGDNAYSYNDGEVQRPTTSNLNFAANQTVANLVIAPVGPDGIVDIYNGAPKGSVQVVADVAGYFTTSQQNAYLGVTPRRILDTRSGVGAAKTPIGAGKTVNVTVAGGADGVPATASAVVIHLTTTDSTRNGFLSAFAAGQTAPEVSNLNYAAGSTTSNTAVVPVGANGQISLQNSSTGSTDIIGDIAGYFTKTPETGASSYIPFLAPYRYIDTRPGATDAEYGQGPLVGPLYPGHEYSFPLTTTATAAIPAIVTNVTVTEPTGGGYLTVYPYDATAPLAIPNTSNLNYVGGQTVANLAFVAPGTLADLDGNYDSAIYLGGHGTAQVIVDEFGEFIS